MRNFGFKFGVLIGLIVALGVFGVISKKYDQPLLSLFPIDRIDQVVQHWISPANPHYDQAVLTQQQQRTLLEELYRHTYSTDQTALSPWNAQYVNAIYNNSAPKDLYTAELNQFNALTNEGKPPEKIGYGENFRPLTGEWFESILQNSHINQFRQKQQYDPLKRAIAIDNLNARILPTNEVHFYDYHQAGQGYPFDNLQGSAVWAGTPLYVLGETQDHSWVMVLTPDYYIAWVQSSGIAYVDARFVQDWQTAAKQQLTGVTRNQVAMIDVEDQVYRFQGYVGMLFPGKREGDHVVLLIPVKNEKGMALIRHVKLPSMSAALVPLDPTMHQFSDIISRMIHRPYGWGNMYFYNDCSAEVKNLYALFGIWLPRHSSQQVNPDRLPGQYFDWSQESGDKRLAHLKQTGHPLMTVVYIGGHSFLYLGQYPNPNHPEEVDALSYQNIWGFRPTDSAVDGRIVIGQSVLLPLIESYPVKPAVGPLYAKKIFQIMNMDVYPQDLTAFHAAAIKQIDMGALLSP